MDHLQPLNVCIWFRERVRIGRGQIRLKPEKRIRGPEPLIDGRHRFERMKQHAEFDRNYTRAGTIELRSHPRGELIKAADLCELRASGFKSRVVGGVDSTTAA